MLMALKTKVTDQVKISMGLNSYEAQVWAALLSRGISAAGELADISKVPRSRCYDVLETLEKKGFVFTKIGKPIKYIAVPPEDVLEVLKKQATLEKNRMLALYDSIKDTDTFTELKTLYTSGISYIDNDKISHSINGKQSINLFLKEIFASAKERVVIHTTKSKLKKKQKLVKKSVGKKVKVRIYAPVDPSEEGNTIISPKNTSVRFIQIDTDQLMVFTSPEDASPEYESAVWIKSKFALEALKALI